MLQLVEEEEHTNTLQDTQPSENITGIHSLINIARYSTMDKLVAVTAYVHRFTHNASKQQPVAIGPLSAAERNAALELWIFSCQISSYLTESSYLQKKQKSACPNLVRQLRLYFDEKQLIRCNGRIHNAPVNDATKFPLLLPPKHHLTKLIIEATHKKLLMGEWLLL